VSGMRVGTPLENWRVSENRLSAIEQQIAELSRRELPSWADARRLILLQRARETAKRSADKCWTLLVEGLRAHPATPLEDWRMSENRLSAIEQQIAELSRHEQPSGVEARQLTLLQRARETAKQSADKCWALLVEDLRVHPPASDPPSTR